MTSKKEEAINKVMEKIFILIFGGYSPTFDKLCKEKMNEEEKDYCFTLMIQTRNTPMDWGEMKAVSKDR